MSFLNSFSIFRNFKRHFIKNRNIFLDRISSVSRMIRIAQLECYKANSNFIYNINTYVTTLSIMNNIEDAANDPIYKRYFKFGDDIENLKDRISKVSTSFIDNNGKKAELRKIINKAIRMRKFYSY